MSRLYIGTSGFSYDDWVGPVYPPDLPKSDWLNYYAEELGFNACELNFSFYRIPGARTLDQLAQKVPGGFHFTLKATRIFTHDRNATDKDWDAFRRAVSPLQLEDKFGCVLIQFPYSFHNTPENQAYLRTFREHWSDLPLVVEFRNRKWINEEVFDLLRQLDMGFCSVDQPRFHNLVPPVAVVTGSIGYVRFHGRNYKKWWTHEEAWERYDYEYSEEELMEWVPKIQHMQEQTQAMYLFANNHYQGKAVKTAQMLKTLLGQSPAEGGHPS